jgi:hypothetical protein
MTDSHTNISFSGPGYITKAVHISENDVQKIVTSRRHRKGRGAMLVFPEGIQPEPTAKHKNPWLRFWAPSRLTWWVAVLFAIGSALFSVGGYGITFPNNSPEVLTMGINLDWIFFIGSIFFTSAASCQLLESINAGSSEGLYAEEKLSDTF